MYSELMNDIKLIQRVYNFTDLIIGGTSSLWIQGVKLRDPKDIDIFVPMSREEFLSNISKNRIKIPNTTYELDWNFLPDLLSYYKPISKFGILLTPIEEIIASKEEFEEVTNNSSQKHIDDLVRLKSLINKDFSKYLCDLKLELINAPIEVKKSFNKIVDYLAINVRVR